MAKRGAVEARFSELSSLTHHRHSKAVTGVEQGTAGTRSEPPKTPTSKEQWVTGTMV